MKWSRRLKEYAGETSQRMIWWVSQKEAEKRIGILVEALEDVASGPCCESPGCCEDEPHCYSMTARAALRDAKEAGRG